jgi:CubicO group peptidase (beta-lactamase class C family)
MNSSAWTGDADSLIGQSNPRIEGGAISNLHDYAKILMMHLNDGMCGEERVLSKAAVAEMQIDRGSIVGGAAYGFGWWITLPGDGGKITKFNDPGASGTYAWIDLDRGYGGYLALEAGSGYGFNLYSRILPPIEAAIDAAESNADE